MSTELVACEFEDSTNCFWNTQEQGNGEGDSFVDIDGTAHYFDYTDVYANDGFIVDCTTRESTHWYEQVVKGFKEEEDGSITMIDLGYTPERYEDVMPATDDEISGRCDFHEELPLDTLPVLDSVEEVPEVVVEVPVIVDPVPEELAITGTGDVVVGLLLGLALLTAGVVLFIKGKKNQTV